MQKIFPGPAFYCWRQTPLAAVALFWGIYRGQPKIVRVLVYPPEVPNAGQIKADLKNSQAGRCPEIDHIMEQIEAFLKGAAMRFSLDSILLDLCSDFQQRVLLAEHGIPRGQVSTYQRLAAFTGNPTAARAVGRALATNPFPLIIPCHRAIRADYTLGGFQGGLPMKRALLEMEGIAFDKAGRVVVDEFFYAPGPGR